MTSVKITEATRRDISDLILIENIAWSGRLEEPEFLSRLYNLKEMPSTDLRFEDAYSDIWQHQVNNASISFSNE